MTQDSIKAPIGTGPWVLTEYKRTNMHYLVAMKTIGEKTTS